MAADRLGPEDLPPAPDAGFVARLRALVRSAELGAVASPFNAALDADSAIEQARLGVELQAFRAAFVGPPLPRGHRAKQAAQRRRAAELRHLLRALRDQ